MEGALGTSKSREHYANAVRERAKVPTSLATTNPFSGLRQPKGSKSLKKSEIGGIRKQQTVDKIKRLIEKQGELGVVFGKGLLERVEESALLKLLQDAQKLREQSGEKIELVGISSASSTLGASSVVKVLQDAELIRTVTLQANPRREFTTIDALSADLKKPRVKEFLLLRVKGNPQLEAYWRKKLQSPPFV